MRSGYRRAPRPAGATCARGLALACALLLGGLLPVQAASQADAELLRMEVEGYLAALPEAAAAEAAEVRQLLLEAERLETAGDTDAAQERLREARRLVIEALTRTRDQETVVYSKEFRTARDEYRYERDRHRTYAELCRELIDRERVSGSMQQGLEQAYEQSGDMVERAEALASRGSWEEASAAAAQANAELARWLKRLGLPVSD